jgi:hypothetical protein
MSVFPRFFFVLSRFRVFFSDGSSKTQPKSFTKKSQQVPLPATATKLKRKKLIGEQPLWAERHAHFIFAFSTAFFPFP